jgi:hypothetical protein
MTFAFMFVLHIAKRVVDFREKDHWASDLTNQIGTDEYERQKRTVT